ncbi:hypothetical protein QZH56_12165 [Streptomyces olivoreticuli]|uniref:hypothetical protein n=1 Tax=Streptomyces olivoreticuli TaxID=68246 RepID=UPI0026589E6D|nr:hypothetical protein [Streptomyces olivoreticuli]WKK26274.1 hypothetical protein QZH56_12165 [Streptomyces olivoreticuli]
MLRHAIAPARAFTQVANDIIRHPELSSDAVRLLIWQLSLPPAADLPLWKVAERAGIKTTGFIRAKRELAAAGYYHEWREQGRGGRWATEQLVSGVPLTAEEAAAVREARPGAEIPAVGEPGRRSVGRYPKENTGENTNQPPQPAASEPVPDPAPDPEPELAAPGGPVTIPPPLVQQGAYALTTVSRTERRLRLTGMDIARLAPLAGEWFQRGACLAEVREALTGGLPDHVHSAAGIIRNRLLRKMPDAPTFAEQRAAERRFVPPPVRPNAPAPPADDTSGAVAAARRGAAAVRAALRGAGPEMAPAYGGGDCQVTAGAPAISS